MGKTTYEGQSMWPGDARQVHQVPLCSAPGAGLPPSPEAGCWPQCWPEGKALGLAPSIVDPRSELLPFEGHASISSWHLHSTFETEPGPMGLLGTKAFLCPPVL